MSSEEPQSGEASPRAFVTATGFVFQIIGFVLVMGACVLWGFVGFVEDRLDEPITKAGDYLKGDALVASTLPPRSLTTTDAPSSAINMATPRPMPRPAPVTMATLPFKRSPMAILLQCWLRSSAVGDHLGYQNVHLVHGVVAFPVNASFYLRIGIEIDASTPDAEDLAVDVFHQVGA